MWTLLKRYQDCVTDSGDLFIGYWARMAVGALRIPYSALLMKHATEPIQSKATFRETGEPAFSEGKLRWNWPQARLHANWTATDTLSFRRTLYDGPEGEIHWDCHLPRARALVTVGDHQLSGLGYAEQLEMTVSPWNLPIHELRWGRFLSTDDAIIWIDWRGPVSRRWVFHNGVERHDANILESRIDFSNKRGVLTLDNKTVVRSGPLVRTVLRPFSCMKCLFPRKLRNMHETKWLTRGTLTEPGHISSGWVINEVVRWT